MMVNSINIFWYLLDKMPFWKLSRQQKCDINLSNSERIQKKLADEKKEKKKNEHKIKFFLSYLTNYITRLLGKKTDICKLIDDAIAKNINQYQKALQEYTESLLSDDPPKTPPPVHETSPDFQEIISSAREKLKQISEQILIVQELIRKVSSSELTAHSKIEQRIVDSISANYFIESQEALSVTKMITVCSELNTFLNNLNLYSGKLLEEISNEISEFQIDPDIFQSYKRIIDSFSQRLCDLQERILKTKNDFLQYSTIESLFSKSDDSFNFYVTVKLLEDEIERITTRFSLEISTSEQSVFHFMKTKFDFYTKFVDQVATDSFNKNGDECDYDEPALSIRESLTQILERISC